MTPEQKGIVRSTWAQIVPIADATAALFYGRLFELDPGARRLFRATDMRMQGNSFVQMITVAVNGLDDIDRIAPALESLGRRHVDYGVEAADYDTVGAALLWAIEKVLGAGWTPGVREAWAETYVILSGIMRRGAGAVEAFA